MTQNTLSYGIKMAMVEKIIKYALGEQLKIGERWATYGRLMMGLLDDDNGDDEIGQDEVIIS